MNILELLKKLDIDSSRFSELTPEEIIRIEKQINIEKRLNPDLDNNTVVNLINAIKNDAKSLGFVYHHPFFRKLFLNENLANISHIPDENVVEEADVKHFLNQYLIDDLTRYFEEKYSANSFQNILELLKYQSFLPEEFLLSVKRKIYLRIDYAILNLKELKYDAQKNVDYISYKSFFDVLSKINSSETDSKVSDLLSVVVDLYNDRKTNAFIKNALVAITNYEAIDSELAEVLKSNRQVALNTYSNKGKSSSGDIPIGQIIWVILIIVKIIFWTAKCSNSNSSSYTKSNSYEHVIKSNEDVRKSLFKENYRKEKAFKDYLTVYDTLIPIQNIDTLKTGDNPFQRSNSGRIESASIKKDSLWIENNTSFDFILLNYKSLGIDIYLYEKAIYIKAGDKLKIANNSEHLKNLISFYFGKKPAIFRSNTYSNDYLRDDNLPQIRFAELPKNMETYIEFSASFDHKLILEEEDGYLNIVSDKIDLLNANAKLKETPYLKFKID